SLTLPSQPPVTRDLESGPKAAETTAPRWLCTDANSCFEWASHSRTQPSAPAAASQFPSADQSTARIAPCGFPSLAICVPLLALIKLTPPEWLSPGKFPYSRPPAIKVALSGENAIRSGTSRYFSDQSTLPVAQSSMTTFWSLIPTARRFPSGDTATHSGDKILLMHISSRPFGKV